MLKGMLCAVAVLFAFYGTMSHAKDECKDVLTEKVLDFTSIKSSREMKLVALAQMTRDDSTAESTDLFGEYIGVASGSASWAKSQKAKLEESLDLNFALSESGSILMLTGQEEVISAWRACMTDKGGRLGAYFTPVTGSERQVLLNIEYPRKGIGSGAGPLKLLEAPFLEQGTEILSSGDCISKGYTVRPGDTCSVLLVVPSAWTILPVVLNFEDENGTRISVTEVLMPRVLPVFRSNNRSQSLPDLYTFDNYVNNPLVTLSATEGFTFLDSFQVIAIPGGAAIPNNSCSSNASLNETRTELNVNSGISNVPAKADYMCKWEVKAIEAKIDLMPPKPAGQ